MPKGKNIEFTLQELRQIILGLRMSGLTFVEPGAIVEIQAMIKTLPSAEDLEKHYSNPESLKKLRDDIGGIMRLIELYGKRDSEYKVRYKSRTGLPPRYKVLEWRAPMQEAAKSNKEELIKEAGIRDMWSAGKEAYYYRNIMGELKKTVEEFGKSGDRVYKLVDSIKNPEFKAKLEQVRDRFYYVQQVVSNLGLYMDGSQELADVSGGGSGATGEKAEIGKPVTFTDNKQYVVQNDGNGNLFINVGGIKQKVITDTLKNVKGFEPLEESHKAREGAKRTWAEYGVDFDKDIDVIARALHDLDWSKINSSALDNLYKIVVDLQSKATAPVLAGSKNEIVKIAQVPPLTDAATAWNNLQTLTGDPNYYEGKVQKNLSALWNGRLDMVNANELKEIIEFAKKAAPAAPKAPKLLADKFKPGTNWVYKDRNGVDISVKVVSVDEDGKQVSVQETEDSSKQYPVKANILKPPTTTRPKKIDPTSINVGQKYGVILTSGVIEEAIIVGQGTKRNSVKVITKKSLTPTDVDIRYLTPILDDPNLKGQKIQIEEVPGTPITVVFDSINSDGKTVNVVKDGNPQSIDISKTKLFASSHPCFNLKKYASSHKS